MFSFVEVSGCMSPRLHPSFVPSLFFSLFFPSSFFLFSRIVCLRLTPTAVRSLKCWRLGVHMLAGGSAGPPQESEAICFKSSRVNNSGGVLVAAQEGKNGVHQVEAGGWADSEIFMSVIWRETKQLIGLRHRSLCLQRQLMHLLPLLFVCPVPWMWITSYCRLTLCVYETEASCRAWDKWSCADQIFIVCP